jgi:transposase
MAKLNLPPLNAVRAFEAAARRGRRAPRRFAPPEREPIPPNTLAELRRDMERRRLVRDQIRQIEDARLEGIERTQ